ncbi:MAG: hypothetical protein VW338_04695 [Rhodospirillaceae bacterium]
MPHWTVPPEWRGEAAFVIVGGPSALTEPIERLEGRHVIAVNSSYERAPWAPVVYFSDARWYNWHAARLKQLPARLVTTSAAVHGERLHRLARVSPPPGLQTSPRALAVRHTSTTGAINLAWHLGADPIVVVGLDLYTAGKVTHHHTPHRFPTTPAAWLKHLGDLEHQAKALAAVGAQVFVTNPASRAVPLFAHRPLVEFITELPL